MLERLRSSEAVAAAMFLDYDNVCRGADDMSLDPCPKGFVPIGLVVREIENKYLPITIRRAYGDFMMATRRVFQQQVYHGRAIRDLVDDDLLMHEHLLGLGFEMLFSPPLGRNTKNRADMQIALDVMEVARTYPSVQLFVIGSGDSDYSPLVQRLKALGKSVVAVGVAQDMSSLLKSLVDGVLTIDTQLIRRNLHEHVDAIVAHWLQDAATSTRLSSGGINLSAMSSGLKHRVADLVPSDFGVRSWRDILDDVFEDRTWATPSGSTIRIEIQSGNLLGREVKATTPVMTPSPHPQPSAKAPRATGEPSAGPPAAPRGGDAQAQTAAFPLAPNGPLAPTRRDQLLAVLNRRAANPYPVLRRAVVAWLRTRLETGSVVSIDSVKREAVTAQIHPEISRSKLNHLLNALRKAGAFVTPEGNPILFDEPGAWSVERDMRFSSNLDAVRRGLVRHYVGILLGDSRLSGDQPVGADDVAEIAALIFSDGHEEIDLGRALVSEALAPQSG